MTQEEMFLYDYLVESGIATANELNLARDIASGTWLEVLNTVLYIRTGYRTLEQYQESEDEEDADMCLRESLEFTGQWW